MSINSTGEWLAFGCRSLGQLLVWEWASESYLLKQQGHFYDMNCLAYSPDGQYVATGGDDSKVIFLLLVTARQQSLYSPSEVLQLSKLPKLSLELSSTAPS